MDDDFVLDPADDEAAHALLAALPCRCERCEEKLSQHPALAAALGVAVADNTAAVGGPPLRLPSRVMALRFLRGCKGDAEKAAHVLTDSLCWRVAFGVDELCQPCTPPPPPGEEGGGGGGVAEEAKVRAVFPFALHGVSKEGHPVQIERTGLVDVEAALDPERGGGPDAFLRTHGACPPHFRRSDVGPSERDLAAVVCGFTDPLTHSLTRAPFGGRRVAANVRTYVVSHCGAPQCARTSARSPRARGATCRRRRCAS